MEYNWEMIYNTFNQFKDTKEYAEYFSEITQISIILNSYYFDESTASILCSKLALKYEQEINDQPVQFGIKVTVVKNSANAKTPEELRNDLQYFLNHIPLFALKRELKSEIQRRILGL